MRTFPGVHEALLASLPGATTPISVFGNVITATRGETVFNEVLGSGDPRVPNQTFTLKKKPLTYTEAPNEVGRESSLRLSVDGVVLPPLAGLRPAVSSKRPSSPCGLRAAAEETGCAGFGRVVRTVSSRSDRSRARLLVAAGVGWG